MKHTSGIYCSLIRSITVLLFACAFGVGDAWGDTWLMGDMNSWTQDENSQFGYSGSVGTISLDLPANTTYEFKVKDGNNWYSYNNKTFTNTDTDFTIYTGNNNCAITTEEAGTYIFKTWWDGSKRHLAVYYPKALLKKQKYIYFDARNLTNWQNPEFDARFWFKFYDTGTDKGDADCTKANALEGWVYYAQVPDDDFVGRIQMNRLNPENHSEVWCAANVAWAKDRSSSLQNCMKEESGKEDYCNSWTPQWTTYCPPMNSSTLTDNGTTTYGGDGGSGTPYLIAAGDEIKLSAACVSAVDDDNMTAYYQFKNGDNELRAGSATAEYNHTSSETNNTDYVIKVEAYNNYNNTDGTHLASNIIYYQTRTPYTISYAAGTGGTGSHDDEIKVHDVAFTLPGSAVFERTGYTQTGWALTDGGDKAYELGGSYTTNSSQTFYPFWTANVYSVTLNTNYGTINSGDVTSYTYGVGATLPTDVTRNNYTFRGWFGDAGFSGSRVLSISTTETGNKEYWAKWYEIFDVGASSFDCAAKTVSITLNGSESGVNYQLRKNGVNEGAAKAGTGSALAWPDMGVGVYTIYIVESGYADVQMNGTITVERPVREFNTTGNWSNTANWSDGIMPTIYDSVRILEPVTVDITDAKAEKIVIVDEAMLTISAGKALIVADSISKADNTANLILESSAEDGNAALVFNNSNGTKATVEMYSKASISGNTWNWQYMGIPFVTTNAKESYYNSYLYSWNSGWQEVAVGANMSAFIGYCITQSAPKTYTMEGTLAETGVKNIDVPAGEDMVIGNSWSAPIQIKQMTAGDFTNLDQTIYLFNTGSDVSGTGGSGERYEAGTYRTIPINAAAATGDSLISSMQGFYVHNTTGSAGKLSLSYDKHVRPAEGNGVIAGPMHMRRRTDDSPAILRIKVLGSRYYDELLLLERADFTYGYDAGWDGENINEAVKAPKLSAIREDGKRDAVSAVPDLNMVELELIAGEDNEYTLEFEYDGDELYLIDNSSVVPVQNGNTYRTEVNGQNRRKSFVLTHHNAPQITTDNGDVADGRSKAESRKLLLDGRLYIMNRGAVYDATGRRITGNE